MSLRETKFGAWTGSHIRIANNILAVMKQRMNMLNLMQLKQRVIIDGVRYTVKSIFGQDSIEIVAPPIKGDVLTPKYVEVIDEVISYYGSIRALFVTENAWIPGRCEGNPIRIWEDGAPWPSYNAGTKGVNDPQISPREMMDAIEKSFSENPIAKVSSGDNDNFVNIELGMLVWDAYGLPNVKETNISHSMNSKDVGTVGEIWPENWAGYHDGEWRDGNDELDRADFFANIFEKINTQEPDFNDKPEESKSNYLIMDYSSWGVEDERANNDTKDYIFGKNGDNNRDRTADTEKVKDGWAKNNVQESYWIGTYPNNLLSDTPGINQGPGVGSQFEADLLGGYYPGVNYEGSGALGWHVSSSEFTRQIDLITKKLAVDIGAAASIFHASGAGYEYKKIVNRTTE